MDTRLFDSIPGLSSLQAMQIHRSITRTQEDVGVNARKRTVFRYPSDEEAMARMLDWASEEFKHGIFRACEADPNKPGDVARVLLTYRWERVAVALAYWSSCGSTPAEYDAIRRPGVVVP